MRYLIEVWGDRNHRVRMILAMGHAKYALEARRWMKDRGFTVVWEMDESRQVRR